MQTMQARHTITEQLIAKTKMMSQEQQRCLLDVLNGKTSDPNRWFSGELDNHRRNPRKNYFMPVDYVIKDRCFRDFTRDISAGGVFIEAHQRFAVGESISLSFMLRHYAYPIKIRGRIVRVAPEGIGIKFLQQDTHQIDELNEVLEVL